MQASYSGLQPPHPAASQGSTPGNPAPPPAAAGGAPLGAAARALSFGDAGAEPPAPARAAGALQEAWSRGDERGAARCRAAVAAAFEAAAATPAFLTLPAPLLSSLLADSALDAREEVNCPPDACTPPAVTF
jgi:hypothetical protein